MAYGKIKADTLVYDNSGSDVEVTLSSLGNKANLNSPTFTGTPVVPGYAPLAGATFTGNVVMSANLTVQGTTTTISSTTINVADKNIEIGKVSTPTDTTADGGGITLKGATDKTITWIDATNNWTFNQGVEIQGPEGGSAFLYLSSDEADDNADKYALKVDQDGTGFYLENKVSGSWEKNINAVGNGAVTLYHDNSAKLATSAAGVTVTGTVTDSKGDVRSIPQNAQTGSGGTYTLVASDAGKHILRSGNGVNLPSNVFAVGDTITIINNSAADISIVAGGGVTLYNTADGATGSRTLAARGMATVIYTTAGANVDAYISGAGLS